MMKELKSETLAKRQAYEESLEGTALVFKKKKLADSMNEAEDKIFPVKKEVKETEWERVQRMRREGDPLILGGRCTQVPRFCLKDENEFAALRRENRTAVTNLQRAFNKENKS